MKKWLMNPAALLKSLGAFALCFVMLFTLTGALAEAPQAADETERDEDISKFGTVTYEPAPLPASGTYLNEGDTIKFKISAKEDPNGLLFALEQMFYQLPEGMQYLITKPGADNQHTLTINIIDNTSENDQIKPLKATVSVDNSTGLLTLTWIKDPAVSPGYELLDEVTNANFNLEVQGTVNGSGDVVQLDGNHRYYVHNPATVTFTKSFSPDAVKEKVANMSAEEKAAYTFTTTVTQAKTVAGEGEFVDKGCVRNTATGHIVYETKNVTFSLADMTYNASQGNYTYTWDNVQPNEAAGITVTETGHADIVGYTYNANNTTTATTSAILPFSSQACSLSNNYTQDVGQLQISKTFFNGANFSSAITAENINNTQKNQIVITVEGTTVDGVAYKREFKYSEMTNGVYTISDIPAGTYTVKEYACLGDYKWVVAQYKIGNSAYQQAEGAVKIDRADESNLDTHYVDTIKTGELNIAKGGSETVELQNGYIQDTGSLQLNKEFSGAESLTDEQKNSVYFYVTTTINDKTYYVWFKETYVRALNEFAGYSTSPTTPPEGYTTQTAFCTVEYAYMAGANNQSNLAKLPVGTYKITEMNANFSGLERETTYMISSTGTSQTPSDEGTTPNFTVEVNDGANTQVFVDNKYEEKGSLKVTKAVNITGAPFTDTHKENTTFQLQQKVGNGWVNVGNSVSYNNFSSGAYTWTDLAYGTYRVVETPASVDNYTLTTTHTIKEYVVGADGTVSRPTSGTQSGETSGEVDVINPYAGSTGEVKNVEAAEVAFTNTYTPITTSMKIAKSFGADYPLSDDKTTLEKALYFQVKDGSNTLKWVEESDGVYVLSNADDAKHNIPYSKFVNGEVTLKGLPVGKSYTVVEKDSSLSGYYRYTYINGSNKAESSSSDPSVATGTLAQNSTVTSSFLNVYEPYATIKVEKSFVSDDLPDAYCNDVIKPALQFAILVKDGDAFKYLKSDGTLTTNADEAQKYSYETLANGVIVDGNKEYKLQEFNRDLGGDLSANYDIRTWITIDNDSGDVTYGTTSAGVHLAPNAESMVKFTNQYTEKNTAGIIPGPGVGVLLNHKTWTGLDNGPSNGTEGKAAQAKVSFKLQRKGTDDWYDYGTYTLGELTGGTRYVWDENGNQIKDEEGSSLIADLILPEGTYRFEEVNATVDGYNLKTTLSILYRVNGENRNIIDRLIIDQENDTNNKTEFTVSGGDIINFSLANVYTPLGNLVVTKTIDQNGSLKQLTTAQKKQVDFSVLFAESNDKTFASIKTFDLSNATFDANTNTYTYTLSDLPVGMYVNNNGTWELQRYLYKVTETNSISGYSCTVTVDLKESAITGSADNAKAEGVLGLYKLSNDEKDKAANIHFNNKYIRQTGGLTITKTFELGNLTDAQKAAVKFEVLQGDKVIGWNVIDGQFVYSPNGSVKSFTYSDMVAAGNSYTILGLPTGNYTVRETNANVEGYLRTTAFTVTHGNGTTAQSTTTDNGKSESDVSPAVNVSDQGRSTVEVKNTYTATGSLKVKKTFAYEGNAEMSEDLRKQMTFTLKQDNTTIETITLASEGVVKDGDVYTYTFTDLPVGQYTIVESNADHDGYTRTTTVTVDDESYVTTQTGNSKTSAQADNGMPGVAVDISHGEVQEVAITNSYSEYGNLKITKEFSGLQDMEKDFPAEEWNNVIYAIKDANGVILPDNNSSYIRNGETIIGTVTYAQLPFTKNNLPAGTYTVEEIILGESNDIKKNDSLFYGYIHTSTEYTVTPAGAAATSGVVNAAATTGEVGNVSAGGRVGAGGTTVAFKNNYSKVPLLKVQKDCENYPETEIHAGNDGKLPVWKFTVTIENLSELNTIDGKTTLTDTFDVKHKEWFALYTAEGYEPCITSNNGGRVESYTDNGDGTATYVIAVKDETGTAAANSITLQYYLQVKDKNALAELLNSEKAVKEPAAKSTNYGTAVWTFVNTIAYKPLPKDEEQTDTANYYYALSPIKKDVHTSAGSTKVTFELIINPDGLRIGSEETLTVYDKMSENVRVDMYSFKVYNLNGTVSEHTAKVVPEEYTGADKKWDLVITVPNEVPLKITYEGTITQTGTVTVTNKAELLGVSSEIEEDVIVTGDSDGTASVAQIYIVKYGAAVTEPLAGAEFTMYEASDLKTPVGRYTSDENGLVKIYKLSSDIAIKWDTEYWVYETKAPAGYQLNTTPIKFVMVDDELKIKDATLEHLFNSKMPCGNAPLETSVTLGAEKTLIGNALAKGQFTIELYDDKGSLLQTKTNAKNGSVTFDALKYTYTDFRVVNADNTVTYRDKLVRNYVIKEKNTGAAGYTYDTAAYQVEVSLELKPKANAADEYELVPTVVYKDEKGEVVDQPAFTNYYNAEGQYVLTGTKTVEGATVIRDAFEFLIKYGDKELCTVSTPDYAEGNVVDIPYPTFKYVVDPEAVAGVVYADGVITTTVKKVKDLEASYTYTISEVEGGNESIEYDNTVYTYTVSASDAGNGTLTVSGTLNDGAEAADFTNNYYGELRIVKKVTVGGQPTKTTLADGSYTFKVYTNADCTDVAVDKDGKAIELILVIKDGVAAGHTITGIVPGNYWVKETAGTNQDVALNTQAYPVEVSGDSTAELAVVTITNNLGIGSLSLTKTVEGLGQYHSDKHADKEFTFQVTVEGAKGSYPATGAAQNVVFEDGVAHVTLTAGQSVTINGLPIGAVYSIVEENLPAGYTAGTITNGSGTIVGGVTEAEQVNTYAAKGEAHLSVTKQVIGNAFTIGDATFTFVLKDEQGNVIETKTGSNENAVDFEKIEYTQPGTYHYTITEVAPETKIPGMEYNTTVYYATVTVTDNGNGTLSTSVKYGTAKNGTDVILVINNKYSKISFQPEVHKAMVGNPVFGEWFEFHLFQNGVKIDGTTAQKDTTATFHTITYHEPGEYNYTIMEIAPAGKTQGMTYSDEVITLKVTVSRNAETGELTVTPVYTGADGDGDNTITNTYVKPVGEAIISVTKVVTGDLDRFDADTKFTFTLAKDSESAAASATNNVIGTALSQEIAKDGTASWSVEYDKPGTYTYTITEADGGVEGVVYDTTPRTVTVVVTYNPITLGLDTVVTYGDNNASALTVTNQYGETSYQPAVQKALLGNEAPEETYSFVLTQTSAPAGASVTDHTDSASVTGADEAQFGEVITYKTPGIYTYTITETAGSTPGMTYSDKTITLTVEVVRAEDGKLSVKSAVYTDGDGEGDTFTNTYRKVTFQPEVTKIVTGEGAPADAAFTFQLKEGDTLVGEAKTIKAGEKAVFDEIVKHEKGVYTYTITEVKGTVPGMAYDTAAHTVTVTVREDEKTRALSAAIKYDESKDVLEVTNVYTTVKYQPKAVKALTGDTDKAPEETFSFTLTQTKAPEGVAAYTETRTLKGTGEVAFSEITFALPGTYVFEIVENPGTTEGMIYSQEKVVVTVNVTADADNQLSLTADYKGGTGADYNTITNKYGETSHQLDVKKALSGDKDRYLENETFTFQLCDSEGNVLQTKTCKVDERVVFDAIPYKTAGTYEYTVVEVKPDTLTPGMTYSDEVINYTVVVYADNEGKLNAIASPRVGDVASNVITNVYARPEGEATIEVTKLISGNAYTGDEEFIFTLTRKEDATATNNAVTGNMSQKVAQNGTASWTIAYDTIGTYTYTIQETKGGTAGMVYDETVHTVTVDVAYSEDKASLVATVTYDGEKTDLDITNKYSEITFQPEITKAVVDKGLCVMEEVFTFGLVQLDAPEGVSDEYTDEAYALVARVDGDQNDIVYGTAQFKPFTYNVPGTYVYEIVELAPEEGKGTPGMTYSGEIITLTVTVARDEITGELTLTAVYTGEDGEGDSTITNTYVKPDGMALIMVNKLVTGNNTQADIKAGLYDPTETFTFTLAKTTQVIVPSATNDVVVLGQMEQPIAAGKSAVWGLTYDQPGVYTYTVTETKGTTDGMEYDETVYHVTVTVDYNEAESGLVAKVSYDDAKTMTAMGEMQVNNKFSAITFQPEIKKTLTGRFLLKETFNFVLTQVDEDGNALTDPGYTSIEIDPASTAFEIKESKTGKFDALVYHEPGTYQYEIVEVIPEPKDRTPGMTYSRDVITYTVVVVKDEATGALSIESETYTTTPAEEGAAAYEGNTFTNAYARPEGEAEIFVNKAMIGNIYNGENEFTFELAKYDPNAVPDEEDKTDPETGTGDDLVIGGDPVTGGIVPSVKSGEITGDNGDSTDEENGSDTEGEPEEPTVPSIKPPVKPGEGELEPLVPMETNNLIFPGSLRTIGVDETAKWTIKYDQPGTYEYTLREIKGDEAGVTYDETIYHVTVVMDYLEDENGDRMSLIPVSITYTDAEGNVIVVETYTDPDAGEEDAETDPEGGDTTTDPEQGGTTEGGEGESTEPGDGDDAEGADPGEGEEPEVVKPGLTITNKYSRVSFVPEISKVVNGRGAPSEYFTFQLTETTEGREYWDTARCLADETAEFNEIVYHEPGVYTYTITELVPEYKTTGMTYSKEVVKLTVRVESLEDGTGALTIETEYSQDTITNKYNPPSYYDYKFSFTKKWQGSVESTLEWTLYDANGNVVHKKFNKDVIDENEWYYEAWFATDKGYYIIEDVPEGYEPIYINVGQFADVTDRLYNGGTIINYKAPQTGDANNPFAWAALMLCSAAAMLAVVLRRKRAH